MREFPTNTACAERWAAPSHQWRSVRCADRDYLKAVQKPFTYSPIEVRTRTVQTPPLVRPLPREACSHRTPVPSTGNTQIVVQCGIALFVGTLGVLRLQGNFLPIRTTEVLGQQYAHAPALDSSRATDPS